MFSMKYTVISLKMQAGNEHPGHNALVNRIISGSDAPGRSGPVLMRPLRQSLRDDQRESSHDAADEGKQTEDLNIGEQETMSLLNSVN